MLDKLFAKRELAVSLNARVIRRRSLTGIRGGSTADPDLTIRAMECRAFGTHRLCSNSVPSALSAGVLRVSNAGVNTIETNAIPNPVAFAGNLLEIGFPQPGDVWRS